MPTRPLYHICTILPGEAHTGEPFFITHTRSEGAPVPETRGQVIDLPGEGLEVSMWCREENPRAIYHNPNDPVHKDSCMEVFLNCFPDSPEYGYIGLEMNANGASHCSLGTARYTREYVVNRGLPHPEVLVDYIALEEANWWRVRCLLSRKLLEALYERDCAFPAGHRMRGNFYKCGDDTKSPHWGSWAPIEKVDFHAPQCFGDIEISRDSRKS
ncbi:MAG: carbohydrate-binding family 9-like protein [Eubacteriales bacterium]|nr:carbohydrate-binding family 9-like protein [Eubacteriales bacterium]